MGDDAANHRVGTGGVGTALGQTQRVGHVQVVKDGERGGHAAMVTPPAWMHAMPSLCHPRLAPTEADICTNQGWHPPGRQPFFFLVRAITSPSSCSCSVLEGSSRSSFSISSRKSATSSKLRYPEAKRT
ncbi:hypothetical protein G6F60_014885 [Rhizopus arrhizus]|nr:hypothetical protein G6F60_014885 [Rhizopus arrhizus]